MKLLRKLPIPFSLHITTMKLGAGMIPIHRQGDGVQRHTFRKRQNSRFPPLAPTSRTYPRGQVQPSPFTDWATEAQRKKVDCWLLGPSPSPRAISPLKMCTKPLLSLDTGFLISEPQCWTQTGCLINIHWEMAGLLSST